ncbi:MAG: hypothetical protein EAZ15_04535 [Sphingobacteriales bacterium]|nr:MAG: hypothetical protein EAZ15_04535 [Sphingobacteriales bacterium]
MGVLTRFRLYLFFQSPFAKAEGQLKKKDAASIVNAGVVVIEPHPPQFYIPIIWFFVILSGWNK